MTGKRQEKEERKTREGREKVGSRRTKGEEKDERRWEVREEKKKRRIRRKSFIVFYFMYIVHLPLLFV